MWKSAFNISDSAFTYLLSYLRFFFTQLGEGDFASWGLASGFSGSLYLCKKHVGLPVNDSFNKFVVCPDPKCNKLYHIDDCFKIVNGRKVPIRCTAPQYKRKKYVGKCDTVLLQANVVRNGGIYHVPKRVYCQSDIKSQIERILSRPGYERYCQEWRDRESCPDTYTDIYDGKLWQEVQSEYAFLADEHDMALLMNFDFFQPFKNRSKSVGVIYLALLNLPRSIRYHSSNMISVRASM